MSRGYCEVEGCNSQIKSNRDLSFFKLPGEDERRIQWLNAIGRTDLILTKTKPHSHVVCSLHFDQSEISYTPKLTHHAVPSKIPNSITESSNPNSRRKMMSRGYCAVEGCNSQIKSNRDLSFFKLPKEDKRRIQWLNAIGRTDLIITKTKPHSHVVCSLHFDKSVICYTPKLAHHAVPSKILPLIPNSITESSNPNTEKACKDVSTQTTLTKPL